MYNKRGCVQRIVSVLNRGSDVTTGSVLKNMHSVLETRLDHRTDVLTEAWIHQMSAVRILTAIYTVVLSKYLPIFKILSTAHLAGNLK